MKRLGLVAATAASVVLLGISAAVPQTAKSNSDTYRQLNLFAEVFERVRSDYVEEVSDETLVKSAINGMLSSLDPHSSYLNAKNFQDMQVQTRGEFGGLGIEVTMENGLVKVVSPIDDTPAARGRHQAERLHHRISTASRSPAHPARSGREDARPGQQRGQADHPPRGQDPFDVSLTRAVIKVQSVKSHLEGDNIGYIRITSFSEQTDSGLEDAIKS